MLISQTAAVRKIRTETGRSEQWATETVRTMKKVQDGKRFKVSDYAVDKIIRAENAAMEWDPAQPSTIRPFSASKQRRLRENCI